MYQGYQIGPIFAQWVIVYFGHQLENYRSSAHFWATFFHGTSYTYVLILTKIGWASFWATFSQIRLVSLLCTHQIYDNHGHFFILWH
jgi:hypothetical protein